MKDPILEYLPIELRKNIYIILLCISLILFFCSSWKINPVTVEPCALLGLASYLTLWYWIGFILLITTSVIVYLEYKLDKDHIYIYVLIALGIFLLGIRVFVEKNAVDPTAYYPTSEVNTLLAYNNIDLTSTRNLGSYYTWPAIHFISASLLSITGLDLMSIMKYAPIFWIICFVFITYGIGKRFKLEHGKCFVISFFSIASWIIAVAGYYYSRFPAMIFFLLLFTLLISNKQTFADILVLIILFSSLVISHGLTVVAVFAGLIPISFYRKDFKILIIFTSIFGAWYFTQANAAFEEGIRALLSPFKDIFSLTSAERYQTNASVARLINRYSILISAALYIIPIGTSLILLLKRKIPADNRPQLIFLFFWGVGVFLIVLWGHGELVSRTFVYCIVPAASIIVLSFTDRKFFISLMCLFMTLSPFSNYAGLAGWGQVLTTELAGAQFLANKVKPQNSYFYYSAEQICFFFDPNLANIPVYNPCYDVLCPSEVNFSIINTQEYVVFNKSGSDSRLFSWGEDPFIIWTYTTEGQRSCLLYNNMYFQIFKNTELR